MPRAEIDREKLRAAIQRLRDEYVFYMLDEAIELLPDAKLAKLMGRYLDLKQLRPDPKGKGSLLTDVKAFEKASLAGKYYESFNVNSKNFMEKSKGTRAWIAECHRLLDRCVGQIKKGDLAEVRESIEVIFDLLRHIDECHDDIIFFADEAGSWQVGVDWGKVLPAWFAGLSATAEPDEYARRVTETIDEFDKYDRAKHLATARRTATPAQRRILRGKG